MNKFMFVARSPTGKRIKGYIKLDDEDELKQVMIEHNYQLLKYRKIKNKKKFFEKEKISKNDILIFCENIYLMIKAGITLKDGLILCAEAINNQSFKKIILDIGKEMEKGKTFSVILSNFEKVFPSHFRTMINLAEVSGNLKSIFEHLISFYKFEIKLKKKIISSLFYPILLLIFCIAVVIVVSIVIIPTFISVFNQMNVSLPLITKIIIWLSNFLKKYLLIIMLVILIFIFIMMKYFKTEKGLYLADKLKLKIPILKKIYLLNVSSKFCRSLKILISSGVPTVFSLQTASTLIGNRYIQEQFSFAIDEVKRGVDISNALYTLNLFPSMLIETIKISEKTANLSYSLQVMAELFEEDEQNKLQKISTIIEPCFILLIAGIVVLLIVAIFVPLFSMLDNIGGF